MKLTTTDRSAFVRAVMDDVPTVDFKKQAHDVVQKHFVSTMPPKLRAVYNDLKLRVHLKTHYVGTGDLHAYFYCANADEKIPAEVLAKATALQLQQKQQDDRLKELTSTLRGTVEGVTTRKRLIEVLPEFEKYAPSPGFATTPNLPALANVVSAFVKAGWPKDAKRARKTAPTT